MIHYALKCDAGHHFESWFQSAAAFDALEKSGHLSCTQCGCNRVRKAMMAPRVATTDAEPEEQRPLSASQSEAEQALAALRRHVEDNADYVGGRFAEEARSIYLGAAPERAIYGEANGAEARALIEDGVPVMPLPFIPNRKSN